MADGKIRLFRNDKGDNPKRPDYRGDGEFDGVAIKASAWVSDKPTKNGDKYLNVTLDYADLAPEQPEAEQEQADTTGGDDLPF